MRLYRPYIPLSVRVAVAARQVKETGHPFWELYVSGTEAAERMGAPWSLGRKLRVLLLALFPHGGYQLNHTPALVNRERKRVGRTRHIKYIPDANDPEFLKYETEADHLFITTGRKPGAERTITSKGSDVWLAKKFRKLEGKTKGSQRPKQKIRSRGFQKGRKLDVRK